MADDDKAEIYFDELEFVSGKIVRWERDAHGISFTRKLSVTELWDLLGRQSKEISDGDEIIERRKGSIQTTRDIAVYAVHGPKDALDRILKIAKMEDDQDAGC